MVATLSLTVAAMDGLSLAKAAWIMRGRGMSHPLFLSHLLDLEGYVPHPLSRRYRVICIIGVARFSVMGINFGSGG